MRVEPTTPWLHQYHKLSVLDFVFVSESPWDLETVRQWSGELNQQPFPTPGQLPSAPTSVYLDVFTSSFLSPCCFLWLFELLISPTSSLTAETLLYKLWSMCRNTDRKWSFWTVQRNLQVFGLSEAIRRRDGLFAGPSLFRCGCWEEHMRLVQNSKVFDIQTDIDRQTEDFLCWCCGIGRDIFLFEAMLRQAAVQHLQQPHSSSSVRKAVFFLLSPHHF